MASENSAGNSTIDECDVISLSRSGTTIAVALCYGVLIPPIVLGNGLVVISFIINHKLRTATNIFICGLGLSDLLIGLFSVPYWTYISSLEVLMDAYCTPALYKVYICLDIWTGCASILQLTAIAIERLYFTVAPLRHRRLPRSIYWYMIGVAWFYSTFMAVLQTIQTNWAEEYSLLLMITCFVFPLFIIVAVYLYILKAGRRQVQKKPSTRNRMGSTGGHLKEFNIFITVIVITGVFVIAWAPFFVVTVVASLCHGCISHPEHDALVRVVKWMQYSSSAINPYIYAYRNEEVRLTFKKILRFICFCGLSSRTHLDKKCKSTRDVHLHSIEQRAQKNDENLGNRGGNLQSKNRQDRQHYPRIILNIDELIGHTSSSGTNVARDSRGREWSIAKQIPRSPVIRVHDPAKKNVGYYENNGFVGMECSTRYVRQETREDRNRNKTKGVDNEAYQLQEIRRNLDTEQQTNKQFYGSHNRRSKRHSRVSTKSKRTANQNIVNRSRDSSNAHLNHNDVTSEVSTNQKRFRRSHDTETTRNVRIDDNEMSHKSTNQLGPHRPRDKEQTKCGDVNHYIRTRNEEISDVSYV